MKKIYLLIILAVSMTFAARVGVLKKDATYSCKEEITIDLDVEDKNNATKIISGDKNLPGISLGGHVVFKYCVLKYETLPRVPFDYIVLLLDKECPLGSYPLARHHDTEDSNNKNSSKGQISPNVVNKNATLYYCFIPSDSKATRKYPFNKEYGVFANYTATNIAHNEIYIDDEDNKNRKEIDTGEMRDSPFEGFPPEHVYETVSNGNSNYWIYNPFTPSDYQKKINKIMSGTNNTTYHVVKWTGSASAILFKSANLERINVPVSAEMSLSPEIKGFNHSAVTVDLKSVGNVSVSIMNAKGAVVERMSQDNLQSGIHVMNWNSGMLPNGLYIVTVKQNGLVSAKNMILK